MQYVRLNFRRSPQHWYIVIPSKDAWSTIKYMIWYQAWLRGQILRMCIYICTTRIIVFHMKKTFQTTRTTPRMQQLWHAGVYEWCWIETVYLGTTPYSYTISVRTLIHRWFERPIHTSLFRTRKPANWRSQIYGLVRASKLRQCLTCNLLLPASSQAYCVRVYMLWVEALTKHGYYSSSKERWTAHSSCL